MAASCRADADGYPASRASATECDENGHKAAVGAQSLRDADNIVHLQLTAMMKVDRRAQIKPPVQGRKLLPVVGNIGFDFPIFLIYPRQAAKNLTGNVRFRTAQRACRVTDSASGGSTAPAGYVFPERKLRPRWEISICRTALYRPPAAPAGRSDPAPAIFRPLLLQCQAGIEEAQAANVFRARLRPASPASPVPASRSAACAYGGGSSSVVPPDR